VPSATKEDYLKQIFLAEDDLPGEPVSMGRVSQALAVSPGTSTAMVKALADDGYLEYRPRVGVSLTDRGRKTAVEMLRRHRILEVFLVDKLGLRWSEVHREAERLEHSISPLVLKALDAFLGHPTHDPHGAPIPNPAGKVERGRFLELSEIGCGAVCRVARVVGGEPEFLDYLSRCGIRPGAELKVERLSTLSGTVELVVLPSGEGVSLALPVARRILVES